MQDEYVRESRKLDALATALCSAAALFADTREKETAVAALAIARMVVRQIDALDSALDMLVDETRHA